MQHEAWHVVQQKQGRVRATGQIAGGTQVNDDVALEQEADAMSSRVSQSQSRPSAIAALTLTADDTALQRAGGTPRPPEYPASRTGLVSQFMLEEESKSSAPNTLDDPTFLDRPAAYAYLASATNFDLDQIIELSDFDGSIFEALDYLGPTDIDVSYWKRNLEGLERQFLARSQGTGGGSKGDWASSKVRSSGKDIANAFASSGLFPAGAYTIHHKISRSALRDFAGKMQGSGAAAQPVEQALDAFDTGANSTLRKLLNIPANLEVGPQERNGDPGSGFDPNLEFGNLTPRSTLLKTIDSEIQASSIDFNEVGRLLKLLAAEQNKALGLIPGRGVLTEPRAGQWKKGKGNRFDRQ